MLQVVIAFSLLQATRVQGVLDVCIEHVRTNLQQLNLTSGSLSSNVRSGCPRSHCLLATSHTLIGSESYVQYSVDRSTTSYLRLLLEFQTRFASYFIKQC